MSAGGRRLFERRSRRQLVAGEELDAVPDHRRVLRLQRRRLRTGTAQPVGPPANWRVKSRPDIGGGLALGDGAVGGLGSHPWHGVHDVVVLRQRRDG